MRRRAPEALRPHSEHGAAGPQWEIPDSKFKTLASRRVCRKSKKLRSYITGHPAGPSCRLTNYGTLALLFRGVSLPHRGLEDVGPGFARSRQSLSVAPAGRYRGRGASRLFPDARRQDRARSRLRHVCFHRTFPPTRARLGDPPLLLL